MNQPLSKDSIAEHGIIQLQPPDEFNRALELNTHPPDWVNPTPPKEPYQLVVIGAGTAGLVTAAGAAGLGARVALVERELMGGDCLNVGCVPSKAIISAARMAANLRDAGEFGIKVSDSSVEFGEVMRRMRRLRAQISPMDSARRFKELGVDVFFGQGCFVDGSTISVTRRDGSRSELKFKKAVIATGARAAVPKIPGLELVNYLTNESLFSLTELPKRFGIIGAGPIGVEMAQAFARLGSEVFLFNRSEQILPHEDREAADVVKNQLVRDGVQLVLGSDGLAIQRSDRAIRLTGKQFDRALDIAIDQLLIATGRSPNTEELGLDLAGVAYDDDGVQVNDFLQTSNPRIYAAGDICSQFKFTHAADFQARIVVQNALFAIGPFGRKRASRLLIPWTTFSSPEIAHVGIYPGDAEKAGIQIDTYTQSFEHIDRAILEGQGTGFVRVQTRKGSDQILGATIVCENAGDLISQISLAINNKIGLSKIAATIHPYPTQAEAIRKLGDQFNKTRLTPLSKRILSVLMRVNVGK